MHTSGWGINFWSCTKAKHYPLFHSTRKNSNMTELHRYWESLRVPSWVQEFCVWNPSTSKMPQSCDSAIQNHNKATASSTIICIRDLCCCKHDRNENNLASLLNCWEFIQSTNSSSPCKNCSNSPFWIWLQNRNSWNIHLHYVHH